MVKTTVDKNNFAYTPINHAFKTFMFHGSMMIWVLNGMQGTNLRKYLHIKCFVVGLLNGSIPVNDVTKFAKVIYHNHGIPLKVTLQNYT